MGKLRQTMVDSLNFLDRVIPERMSQVSRQLEVGNHKQRTLNTRLSSGTSAGTFACPVGPYRNCVRDLDAAHLRPALEQGCGKQTPSAGKLSLRVNLLYVPNIKI